MRPMNRAPPGALARPGQAAPQHLLTDVATNLARLDARFTEQPHAATRPSKLGLLLAQPLVTAPLA
jgi:hypothetical protein